MDPIGLACCLLATVCWAIGPVFLRKSLDTFDNTEINAVRSIGTVAVSAFACFIFNPSFLAWKYGIGALAAVFIMMFLGNIVGDLLFLVAIDNIGVGRTLSTANSYPVFVSLFSAYWLGETLSLKLLAGTGIIVAGLVLLNCSKKSSLPPSEKARSNTLGFSLAIITSVLWALSLTIQKWALTAYHIDASSFIFWRGLMLGFTVWGFWYFRKGSEGRRQIFNAGFKKWLSPILAGAFSLAIGGIAFARALETVPVSMASPITASNPVIAAVIARFAFNERLTPLQWFGIVMVIVGGIEVSA